jgi:hypothetical protein
VGRQCFPALFTTHPILPGLYQVCILPEHGRRKLDRTVIRQLATCRWVAGHHNVLITGPTGVGKTFLGCALGQQACRHAIA